MVLGPTELRADVFYIVRIRYFSARSVSYLLHPATAGQETDMSGFYFSAEISTKTLKNKGFYAIHILPCFFMNAKRVYYYTGQNHSPTNIVPPIEENKGW